MSYVRSTPGSQTSLREANRARIVDAIKHHGGLTQVELAGITGLSPATVSNIVKELSASGVLHTTPTSRSGRRAQHVTLAHAVGLVAGVHVSARHLRVALADVAGVLVAEHHMPLAKDHRADNELDRAARLIADMLESVDSRSDEILAVGVAVPAPVRLDSGQIARVGLMRGWDGLPIDELLGRRMARPVFVDNDANLAALAELQSGAVRGKHSALFVDVSYGLGAGLIVNGQIYRGHRGGAGEFGHMTIVEDGPLCRCGNRGCIEAIAGGHAILDGLRASSGALKLHDVVVRALTGDARCIRAIADAGKHLGSAVAAVCNLLDPEHVVIGGELGRAGELLLGPLRHSMERSVLWETGDLPDVVQGQLGERAALVGAILFAIEHIALRPEELGELGRNPASADVAFR
ncbi:MAG: ROK family transcriptional regulator [Microbacteriaceae bacterium]